MQINSLDDANKAVENGLLVKTESDGPERTAYYTTSDDGWQKGYLATAGTLGHEVVDVGDVRDAITAHIIDENATVTAVSWDDSPWGRERGQ